MVVEFISAKVLIKKNCPALFELQFKYKNIQKLNSQDLILKGIKTKKSGSKRNPFFNSFY